MPDGDQIPCSAIYFWKIPGELATTPWFYVQRMFQIILCN